MTRTSRNMPLQSIFTRAFAHSRVRRPKSIPEETARRRLNDLVLGAQHYAGLPSADSIAIKRRQRQRGRVSIKNWGRPPIALWSTKGALKRSLISTIISIPVYSWIIGHCGAGSPEKQRPAFSESFQLHRGGDTPRGSGWRDDEHER